MTADLELSTSEIEWPYIRQPKYKPQVIMS